ALALANGNPATADTITFAENLQGGTLFLTQGKLTILTDVTIDGDIGGDGTADITVSADSAAGANDATSEVFRIGTRSVTLNGLVVRDGNATCAGGGIYIYGNGDLTLIHTTVTANQAFGAGGGICGTSATISLIDSAVTENTARLWGGGIAGGTVSLVN